MQAASDRRALTKAVSLLAGAVALPLGLTSCSTKAAEPARTTAVPVVGTRCALISPASIHAALGTSVATPTVGGHGSATICTYKGTNLAQSVIIRYDSDAKGTTFTNGRVLFRSKGDKVGKILGLGDEAYYVVATSGGKTVHSVVARRDGQDVLVTGATGTLPQFEILAGEALSSVAPASSSTSSTAPRAQRAEPYNTESRGLAPPALLYVVCAAGQPAAMPTTGWLRGVAPADPSKGADP